ncbi:Uncharacterised protein [Candidatus Gugararchaeum adminiculabundum]|nr:Uncharacterised protein [Candidatus Gugararchaeum adminiculabundum]
MGNISIRRNMIERTPSDGNRVASKSPSPFYHKLLIGGALMLMTAGFALGITTGCAKKPAPTPRAKPAAGARQKPPKNSKVEKSWLVREVEGFSEKF